MKDEILLKQLMPSAIKSLIVKDSGTIINVKSQYICKVAEIVKLSSLLTYNVLLDAWATDQIQPKQQRFCVHYMLLSKKKNKRLYLKLHARNESSLAQSLSLTNLFSSAGFLEREIWDLFGIFFISHPDLRRLLTDYGFKGFPLRKDFPVTGFKEIKYDDKSSKLVYTPIDFTQTYRLYTYHNPWK